MAEPKETPRGRPPVLIRRLAAVMEAEPWRLDLIRRYAASVERWGLRLDRAYPGEDMVPLCFQGLYLAATDWDESKGAFFSWLKIRVRNSVNPVVRRRQRWRMHKKPIKLCNLNVADFDRRYFYQ